MNTRLIPFFLFLIVSQLSAQTVTIHILSPWAQDSVRSETPLYIISNESGWWPGAQMVSEGGGWYSYTFTETPKTSTERIEFMSVIPTPHDAQAERVFYTGGAEQISMQRLFASDTSAKDVWLSTPDLESEVEITLDAPESRVLYFFNPWDLGAPRVLMTDGRIMRMNLEPSFCGWSSYRYYGTTDSAAFKFLNSMDSSLYTASGLSEGDFINLQEHFTKHDTAWILPTPYPEGPPELHSIFPGKKGDCGVLLLGAVMRDMAVDHPDFQLECMGHKTGMVEKRLDSNGKPIQTDTAQCAFDIASWFQPESLGNGYTNQTCYNMLLQKNDEGLFEIDNDNFFPLDDFEYLDEEETVPNPNHSYDRDSNFMHNYFFTMEISAEFDYSPGQTFYFRGDDDVWVFIDSSLVVDIGGIHGPVEGAVDLDTLGLTPGNTYSFKLFFAERHCCGSNFRMVTSLNLRTSSKIFHKTNEISEGITHYDLFERVTQSNLSCDPGASSTEIRDATVDFYIEGPSFETAKRLLAGTSYGGITISDDYSSVVVEENAVTDLLPGGYVIRYYLQSDDTQEGFVSFIVPGDPPLDVNNVVSAFCYADNGYGRLDNLELTYEDTLQALPDSITISWPELENSKTVYPDNMTLEADEKTVSMVLPEPFEGSITTYSGTDRLGVSYMSSPRKETVTFRVKEKIGPLITDAVLLERTEEGLFPDTLLITFSEPVPTDSIMEEALLAITPGGQERALTVLNAAKTYDGVRIIVNQRVYPEDSIRINPQSQLCDYYGNRSHLQNRFVALQLKLGIPRVEQAYYKDGNADGIVETGILQFNRPVNYYSFQPIFAWPNGAMADTLKAERFTYGQDSSEVIVQLGGAFDKTVENITAGNLNLKFQMTGFNESGFAVLQDSAASVLVSAKYTFSTGDTLSDRDTLEVIFSESVSREFAERPFVFKRGDCDTTYSMTLE
ncbi:MAG: fibro-slime domain-containing protein, partial [Chitinispirillaceae bacterium]